MRSCISLEAFRVCEKQIFVNKIGQMAVTGYFRVDHENTSYLIVVNSRSLNDVHRACTSRVRLAFCEFGIRSEREMDEIAMECFP